MFDALGFHVLYLGTFTVVLLFDAVVFFWRFIYLLKTLIYSEYGLLFSVTRQCSANGCWRKTDFINWNCNFVGLLHHPFWLQLVLVIIFNFWIYFVLLRITDEGSLPEIRISSILLIKSDLKWCLHLSRSLSLYKILYISYMYKIFHLPSIVHLLTSLMSEKGTCRRILSSRGPHFNTHWSRFSILSRTSWSHPFEVCLIK